MVMTQDNTMIWAGTSSTAGFQDWDTMHDGHCRPVPTWKSPKVAERVMDSNRAGSRVARRWERRHRSDMEDWKVIKVREIIEFIEDCGPEYYHQAVDDDEDEDGDVYYDWNNQEVKE